VNQDEVITQQPNAKTPVGKKIGAAVLVICGIILVLFVVSHFPNRRSSGKRHPCLNHLKQLSVAVRMYCEEHGRPPDLNKWCDQIMPILSFSTKMFVCPDAPRQAKETGYTYGLNPHFVIGDSRCVLLFETNGGWNKSGGADMMAFRNHGGRQKWSSVAFADGHVEVIRPEDAGKLKWQPEDVNSPNQSR